MDEFEIVFKNVVKTIVLLYVILYGSGFEKEEIISVFKSNNYSTVVNFLKRNGGIRKCMKQK